MDRNRKDCVGIEGNTMAPLETHASDRGGMCRNMASICDAKSECLPALFSQLPGDSPVTVSNPENETTTKWKRHFWPLQVTEIPWDLGSRLPISGSIARLRNVTSANVTSENRKWPKSIAVCFCLYPKCFCRRSEVIRVNKYTDWWKKSDEAPRNANHAR